eukprot:scaffold22833_cov134-Isochrysis_galbana.AAC.2
MAAHLLKHERLVAKRLWAPTFRRHLERRHDDDVACTEHLAEAARAKNPVHVDLEAPVNGLPARRHRLGLRAVMMRPCLGQG